MMEFVEVEQTNRYLLNHQTLSNVTGWMRIISEKEHRVRLVSLQEADAARVGTACPVYRLSILIIFGSHHNGHIRASAHCIKGFLEEWTQYSGELLPIVLEKVIVVVGIADSHLISHSFSQSWIN